MKLLVFTFCVHLAGTSLATGQAVSAVCGTSETPRALCAAEADLTDALRRNDVSRLAALYGDDFQLINFRGRVIDKAGVLSALRSGTLRFDSLTTSDLQLRVYQGTGVITGIQHQVAREPGGDDQAHPKEVRFTHIYILRGGAWRLVASQITPTVPTPRRP